jgi:hypothetical protein
MWLSNIINMFKKFLISVNSTNCSLNNLTIDKYNIGETVKVINTINVARRYLGRKGLIVDIGIIMDGGDYGYIYALKIYDRISLLWMLENEIEKL